MQNLQLRNNQNMLKTCWKTTAPWKIAIASWNRPWSKLIIWRLRVAMRMSAEGLVFLPLKRRWIKQVTGNSFGASGASNKKPNKIGPMHSAMLFPVVKAPCKQVANKKTSYFRHLRDAVILQVKIQALQQSLPWWRQNSWYHGCGPRWYFVPWWSMVWVLTRTVHIQFPIH